MRVLIAADIFPPIGGGPAIYAAGFSNALIAQGDEVTVVSLTPASDISVTKARVVAVTKKNKVLKYLEYLGLLFRYARQAEVVYAMGPVNAGLPAWLAATLFGKKFVVKVVGDYAWEQSFQRFGVTELIDEFQTKKYSGTVRILQMVQKFVVRSADQVIVPSEYLKKIVIGWGVLVDNIQVIYTAIEFTKVAEPVVKNTNEIWILTGPRLVPWKGIRALINVLRKVQSDFPQVRLKVFGDGPERNNLEELAKTTGVEDMIEFLGYIPNSKVLGYMQNSEIFILNSGYEGLSHVLVEALYANCQVLASNVGGNPEVIIPGQTGLLFSYNNEREIEKNLREVLGGMKVSLLENPDAREKFFGKFEFKVMVSKTTELLEKICGRS